jgi:hypothetical protein
MSKAKIINANGDPVGVEVFTGNIYLNSGEGQDEMSMILTKAEAMMLARMLQNAVWEVTQNEHV